MAPVTVAEVRLAIEATVVLLVVRVALAFVAFDRVMDGLDRLPRTAVADRSGGILNLDRLRWAVRIAGRLVPRSRCLARALVAYALLRRRGFTPRMEVGIAPTRSGSLAAHAWVHVDGHMVVGAPSRAFLTGRWFGV